METRMEAIYVEVMEASSRSFSTGVSMGAFVEAPTTSTASMETSTTSVKAFTTSMEAKMGVVEASIGVVEASI